MKIVNSKAFSLIELLIVMAIIVLLAAMTIPSMTGILGGSKVSMGVETVMGALSSARQLASTKNRQIEFRLITMADPTSPFTTNSAIRAIQILEIRDTGTNPIGKPRVLPAGVIIGSSTNMSSLAALTNTANSPSDPTISGVSTYTYQSFHFRPDGSLDLNNKAALSGVTNYFLTIYDEKFQPQISGSIPPMNFATIQLEPATGVATVYRP